MWGNKWLVLKKLFLHTTVCESRGGLQSTQGFSESKGAKARETLQGLIIDGAARTCRSSLSREKIYFSVCWRLATAANKILCVLRKYSGSKVAWVGALNTILFLLTCWKSKERHRELFSHKGDTKTHFWNLAVLRPENLKDRWVNWAANMKFCLDFNFRLSVMSKN